MNRRIIGCLYDADTRVLNLQNLNTLMTTEGVAATWFTKQPWRAEINYYNGVFYMDRWLSGQQIEGIQDTDIWSLIQHALAVYGV